MFEVPAHARAVWEKNAETGHFELMNGDSPLPLWSGKGEPPAIGAEVETSGNVRHKVTITGYTTAPLGNGRTGSWLMALAHRHHDNKRGDLAGAEIEYSDDQRYPDVAQAQPLPPA
jgi:hypothetical protein